MQYNLRKTPSLITATTLVFGLFSDQSLPQELNLTLQEQNLLSKQRDMLKHEGDYRYITLENNAIILIHFGDAANYSLTKLKTRLTKIIELLTEQHAVNVQLSLPSLANNDNQLFQMVTHIEQKLYQFNNLKNNQEAYDLQNIDLIFPYVNETMLDKALAVSEGIQLARDLANLPANKCTPSYLAEQALLLSQLHPEIKTTILEKEDLQNLGMGLFLSVADGSHEPPKFIEIHYNGNQTTTEMAPIVLIGKGITFDSGGISIKPSQGMEEMKFDMAGGASVLGTLKACATQKLPINVIGLIPATENMPGGGATKPGDVITSLSGQTVEVTNTDAEGRLILADALTYAERFKPKFVIDVATLTGAIIISLGNAATGLFTNDENLAKLILTASETSDDFTWRMPLTEHYDNVMDGVITDLINSTGDKAAGSINGAVFLKHFAKNFTWAHLDIAGTAWISGKNRMATGRPVQLLNQILNDVAAS